jgi:hypothetical protein
MQSPPVHVHAPGLVPYSHTLAPDTLVLVAEPATLPPEERKQKSLVVEEHRRVGMNTSDTPHQMIFAELESMGSNWLIRRESLVVLEADKPDEWV